MLESRLSKLSTSRYSVFKDKELIGGNKQITEHYRKWVHESGPYYWFITITFKYDMPFPILLKYVKKFIHNMNLKYFKANYYNKKESWMEGFAFIEDHPMKNSNNPLHVHMLIKMNERYLRFTPVQQEDIFIKAVKSVITNKSSRVFSLDAVDLKHSYFSDSYNYFFDELDDFSLHRMKIIGKDLLSDSLGYEKEYYTKSYDRAAQSTSKLSAQITNSDTSDDKNETKLSVLKSVYKMFKKQKYKQLKTSYIINMLCSESLVFRKYNKGEKIVGRQLASLLKPFSVSSCSLYYKTGNAKGYKFKDVRKAYRKFVRGVAAKNIKKGPVNNFV